MTKRLEKYSSKVKPFVCQYCKHGYVNERTLLVHICEQKRRHLAKSEKHVILGYQTFVKFFQMSQNKDEIKSYDEFAKSPFYNAFVKFGSFMSNTKPLYPDKFINWIVSSSVKIDYWCRDELYEKYVLELIHTESVETALERSITHMQDWANTHNDEWNRYFINVSQSRAIFDIKDGKISPWLLLNCKSGKTMLANFHDSELVSVGSIIDPQKWAKKFSASSYDVQLVKQIAKEANL